MKYKSVIPPDQGINKYQPIDIIEDNFWSDCYNMNFGIGYIRKVTGWRPFDTNLSALGSPIRQIDNYYKYNGNEWLIFCTNNKVYWFNNSTHELVEIYSGLTTSDDHQIMTENFGDNFIITNGLDTPIYWDGVLSTMAIIPGINDMEGGITHFQADCLINYKNYLIFGNTTEDGTHFPQRIRWCQLGDMTKWKNNTDGTGGAGWLDLSEGVDWVQNMKLLGDYLIVYKERSIEILSYVGGDDIFSLRPAVQGTGLLAPKAIIDLGTEHIFIGPDNIYSFDLIEPKIAGDNISNEFFRLLNPSKADLTTGFFIEEIPEAYFVFVSVDSPDGYPDKALIYNTDTKAWSIRDLPMTAFGYYNLQEDRTIDSIEETIDSILWEIDSSTTLANAPINICGDKNGNLYVLDGHNANGNDIDGYAVTKLYDFGDPGILKRLMRIQLMISREGPYNLEVTVGTADNVDEPITWHPPYYMKLDKTYPPWVDIDLTARYFIIKFRTQHKDEPFKITGYKMYYQERTEL
jgi:hypothetical protein